jgi:hypothetical protein
VSAPQAFSRWRVAALAAGMLAAIGAVAVLFLFDPSTAGFYPVCQLHELTGLQCPGCGGLRALHQLSHGRFAAAWRLNPFVPLLLPVVIWLGLREIVFVLTGRQWPGLITRPVFAWLLAGSLLLFGILRNIHFA